MSVSLLNLLMNLLNDPAQKGAFVADPQGFLADCGLSDLSAEDIHDAIQLAGDTDSHAWNSHGWKVDHGHGPVPPPPVHHHHPGDTAHETAVKYLNSYITNNYNDVDVDARETTIDNSVHQDIHNDHGGVVVAPIDSRPVDATGDGAVAVGGNNSGTIATGADSVAGNGNVVNNGDDNTQSFGSGTAVNQHAASATDGGALSGTGPAVGGDHTDSHDALTNFGSGSVANDGGQANQTANNTHADSHDTTDSHQVTDDHSVTDADNTVASNNDLFSHDEDDHSLASQTTTTDDHHVRVDHNPVDVHV